MSRIVANRFRDILKTIQKIENPINPIVNNLDLDQTSPFTLMNTYVGDGLCGPACFVVKKILEDEGIKGCVKKTLADPIYLNGEYLEDHCVIFLEDNTIIDPTIRQLLIDERSQVGSKYSNYVFNYIPPIFVGSIDEYYKLIKDAIKLNKIEYGSAFCSEHRLIRFCNYPIDIDYRFKF